MDGDGWPGHRRADATRPDRKSTRLNSSHLVISYAVFCLKKKKKQGAHLKTTNIFSKTETTLASSEIILTLHIIKRARPPPPKQPRYSILTHNLTLSVLSL